MMIDVTGNRTLGVGRRSRFTSIIRLTLQILTGTTESYLPTVPYFQDGQYN